jgi:hypothetical protein
MGAIVCETDISCRLYLNGQKLCESSWAHGFSKFGWQTKLTVGYSADSPAPMTGLVDHLSVYRRALGKEELADLKSKGHPIWGFVEQCDGLDNNCNGAIDESGAHGCTEYWEDPDEDGYGQGEPTCLCEPSADHTATRGGDCNEQNVTVNPGSTEICDGVDNDCDGAVDNVPDKPNQELSKPCYTGPKGTEDVGVCHGGIQICNNGGWATCVGEVVPTNETCDGTDQDCDGFSDIDEPGEGDLTEHPCYEDAVCDFGTCYCMENEQSGNYSCILE